MAGLPSTLNPTVAGGVLTLAGRQLAGQFSWAARPTDKFIVDTVDATNHVAYCRRSGDLVSNNEYPFPYPSNLTLHPDDAVIVEWDPSGPFIVGGGTTGAGSGEVIQHNGTDVGEENGLNFRDFNTVAWNIEDDPADNRVNVVGAAPLPSGPHYRPGDGFEHLPTSPPELPPLAESLGTGTGPLGLPYYALAYTTAGDPTELGAISMPVDGTTEVAVGVPTVPGDNVDATGQLLYRSDDGGQTWGLIQTYTDLTSHVFTDTGVSLGLAPAVFGTIAQVQRAYTDAIHGVSQSNSSDLGLGGVTGKGLTVGNHEDTWYRPDPATIKFLAVTPPEDTVSVSASVGDGPGAGDRQYMKVYHTASAGDSSKGPSSRWIDGTLATGVAIAGVPNFPTGVWDDVTGQAVYRTKKGGGGFFLLQDYPGSRSLQAFIDTTPDADLGEAWVDQPTIIRAIGLSSCAGTPPGSGDGGTVGGGLPVTGSDCLVQPTTLTPPTTGGIPVPGGTAPGAPNAGKPGYDCTGATTLVLTPPSPTLVGGSHSGGGQWAVSDSPTSFTEVLVDPTIEKSSGFVEYAGPSNLTFVLCHLDLHIPTASSYTGGPTGAPDYGFKVGYGTDFLGSWPGISWQAATSEWVFARSPGVQITGGTLLSVQPGPDVWLAFGVNCATGHTEYWLGTSIGDLQLAYVDTSGGDLPSATVAFEYVAGSSTPNATIATMDGMQWFTGKPQSVVFDDGGTITGGAPADCPSGITGGNCTAYQQGWSDEVAGALETDCPYTGGSGLCPYWELGWIDANNYYFGLHHDGGTGHSGIWGPPATPPSSVPGAYFTQYSAGYQAYLDGKPDSCPYISIDSNDCLYWTQGWRDAYNVFNTKVGLDGKVSGFLPGGSTDSETCLNGGVPLTPDPTVTPPSPCGSIPVTGDMSVAGAVTSSGPMSAPSFNGLVDGGVWT